MHQMPIDQYKELYQPTFSVPQSPAQDLQNRRSTMPRASRGFGPMP
jgi:hypothetical protein